MGSVYVNDHHDSVPYEVMCQWCVNRRTKLTPPLECAPEGGQVARLELTGNAGLSEDGSHGQAPNLQY